MTLWKRRGTADGSGIFSNFRFRTKIMLGFAAVLGTSVLSMAVANIGFDRISTSSQSYQTIVVQSDSARDIDRELTAYRLLARYYVLTSFVTDLNAAKEAEKKLAANPPAAMQPGGQDQIESQPQIQAPNLPPGQNLRKDAIAGKIAPSPSSALSLSLTNATALSIARRRILAGMTGSTKRRIASMAAKTANRPCD